MPDASKQVGSAAGLDGSLQPGDVIVRMDGVQISSLEQVDRCFVGHENLKLFRVGGLFSKTNPKL